MAEAVENFTPRLKTLYEDKIRGVLNDEFKYSNVMMTPKLDKIVINMGVGDAVNDRKAVDAAYEDLLKIAGQKPVVTRAKKSIAGFKLR